jgi:hypothetical protein
MTSPLAIETQLAGPPPCSHHGGNTAVASCAACNRPVCHVCVFTIGSATYCPDCVTAGPSGEERSSAFNKGLLSIALAVIGFAITAQIFLRVFPVSAGASTVLSYPWLGSSMGGVALALVGRDGARRRGSVLPTIGLAANGVLLAIQALSTIYGLFFMH